AFGSYALLDVREMGVGGAGEWDVGALAGVGARDGKADRVGGAVDDCGLVLRPASGPLFGRIGAGRSVHIGGGADRVARAGHETEVCVSEGADRRFELPDVFGAAVAACEVGLD